MEKLKSECFYSKFFEVSPNKGFYINLNSKRQFCADCIDNDNCLSDNVKSNLFFKNVISLD